MISSIYLENWRSHDKTEMKFHRGSNVLIGMMGAGKSSVIDAMAFGLFGTFPALQSRRTSLDSCVMNKPTRKERAIVKVGFIVDKEEYTATREITVGKGVTKSELRKAGGLVEGPQAKRVTEVIQSLLGVNYDLFSRAVYSEQNQMDYFLQIRPNQRKKVIDGLLQLDRFESARQTVGTVVNRLRIRASDKEQEVGRIKQSNAEEEKAKAEKELEKIRVESGTYESDAKKLRKENSVLGQELRQMEEKQKQFTEKSMENERQKVLKQNTETQIKRIEGILGRELLKVDAEEQLKSAKKELEELLKAKDKQEEKESQMKEKMIRLEGDIRVLEEKVESVMKETREVAQIIKETEGAREELKRTLELIDGLKKKITKAEAEKEKEEKRIKALEENKEECPVCKSAITEKKREELIADAKNAQELAAKAMNEAQKQFDGMNTKKLEESTRAFAVAERRAEALEKEDIDCIVRKRGEKKGELEALGTEFEKTRRKLLRAKDRVEKKRGEFARVEYLVRQKREHDTLVKKALELGEGLRTLVDWFKDNPFKENELTKLRELVRKNSEELAEAKSRIEMSGRLIKEKNTHVMAYSKQLEVLEQVERESVGLKQNVNDMVIFKKALEETQVRLRGEFTYAVNAALDDIWSRIYPYGDYVSLKVNVEDEDYLLQLQDRNGNWVDVEGNTSGGERSTAALCLRIAFSLVLTRNLSWLVLDEPTHNIDRRGVNMLSEALRQHLPDLVEQVFIITHNEQMEKAGKTLYRLERTKEKDGPTKVQLITEGPA